MAHRNLVTGAVFTEIVTLSNGAARSPYSKHSSTPKTVRLPNTMLARVERVASARGMTVADLVRLSLGAIAGGEKPGDSPQSIVSTVAAALDLADNATPSDVLAAFQALVESILNPAAPPPPGGTPTLSSRELAGCLARKLSPAAFIKIRGGGLAAPIARRRTASLSNRQLRAVQLAAAKRKITALDLARLSLRALSAGVVPFEDPESVLTAVAKALGLPDPSTPQAVLEAVSDLVTALTPADSGATEHADPAPAGPPGTAFTSKLSKAERAGIKRLGISEAEYLARKANAVRRI